MQAWRTGTLPKLALEGEAIVRNAQIPTLILHGRHDFRFPVSVAQRLHNQVPETRLEILEKAGHLAHIEQTGPGLHAVDGFIRQCNP